MLDKIITKASDISANYDLVRRLTNRSINLDALKGIATEIYNADSLRNDTNAGLLAGVERIAYHDLDTLGVKLNGFNLFMQSAKGKRDGLITGDVLQWLIAGYLSFQLHPAYFKPFRRSTLEAVQNRLQKLARQQPLHSVLFDFKTMKPATHKEAVGLLTNLEATLKANGFRIKNSKGGLAHD